eukprot:scaffold128668_cov60-Phaeocystis_antarctica.AAC.1
MARTLRVEVGLPPAVLPQVDAARAQVLGPRLVAQEMERREAAGAGPAASALDAHAQEEVRQVLVVAPVGRHVELERAAHLVRTPRGCGVCAELGHVEHEPVLNRQERASTAARRVGRVLQDVPQPEHERGPQGRQHVGNVDRYGFRATGDARKLAQLLRAGPVVDEQGHHDRVALTRSDEKVKAGGSGGMQEAANRRLGRQLERRRAQVADALQAGEREGQQLGRGEARHWRRRRSPFGRQLLGCGEAGR